MEKYYKFLMKPTFRTYRCLYEKKSTLGTAILFIKYCIYLVGVAFVWIFFFILASMVLASIKSAVNNKSKYSHRNSEKFKKVIKEGVFFDTVEYHEI